MRIKEEEEKEREEKDEVRRGESTGRNWESFLLFPPSPPLFPPSSHPHLFSLPTPSLSSFLPFLTRLGDEAKFFSRPVTSFLPPPSPYSVSLSG